VNRHADHAMSTPRLLKRDRSTARPSIFTDWLGSQFGAFDCLDKIKKPRTVIGCGAFYCLSNDQGLTSRLSPFGMATLNP
jgi:hypothetical protein